MPPANTTNRFMPATRGKFLTRTFPVSIFLLTAGFLSALIAIIIRPDFNWPEAWLLALATFSTLLALARQLPLQNVFLAAFIIAFVGGLAHLIGANSGIPFGSFMLGPAAGQKFLGWLPWTIPLLWVLIILNSRGVARLIMRPWRKTRTYGLWLIGLTALLAMLFDCALEPFATHTKHYWIWMVGGISLTPWGAPISNSIAWFIISLLILAFATPVLINKQLSKRSTPDFHPLALWLGAILLFAAGAATQGLWPVVAVDGVIALLTAGFAIRGGRW